jgi:hypothetical protein
MSTADKIKQLNQEIDNLPERFKSDPYKPYRPVKPTKPSSCFMHVKKVYGPKAFVSQECESLSAFNAKIAEIQKDLETISKKGEVDLVVSWCGQNKIMAHEQHWKKKDDKSYEKELKKYNSEIELYNFRMQDYKEDLDNYKTKLAGYEKYKELSELRNRLFKKEQIKKEAKEAGLKIVDEEADFKDLKV